MFVDNIPIYIKFLEFEKVAVQSDFKNPISKHFIIFNCIQVIKIHILINKIVTLEN